MHSDENTLESGTLIDSKYRIEKLLGVGGMGTVYVATHVTIDRTLALKTLHKQYTTNEEVIRRFHQEARAAGSIAHDNICEVTDFGNSPECGPYLVMPLLNGISLTQYMEQGRVSLPQMVSIFLQVLDGLMAAHHAGIVHRDLKPDNIFICRVGMQRDFVKLLDFGISKLLQHGIKDKITVTGVVMGTPHYMSPEQARGAKEIDQSVDVYAVGAMMYELATGKEPFTGDNYNEILYNVITAPYAPPRELNELVPETLEHVILKAMAREREDRYATSKEMHSDLMAVAMDLSPSTEQILVQGPEGPYLTPISTVGIPYNTPLPTPMRDSTAPSSVTPASVPRSQVSSIPAPQMRTPVRMSRVSQPPEQPSELTPIAGIQPEEASTRGKQPFHKTRMAALAGAVIAISLGLVTFGGLSSDPTPEATGSAPQITNFEEIQKTLQSKVEETSPDLPPTQAVPPAAEVKENEPQIDSDAEIKTVVSSQDEPSKKKKRKKRRSKRKRRESKASDEKAAKGRLGTELIDW